MLKNKLKAYGQIEGSFFPMVTICSSFAIQYIAIIQYDRSCSPDSSSSLLYFDNNG